MDIEKRTSKERYYWLKEHHICVYCGQRDAERNSTLCYICREKARTSHRQSYKRMKKKDNQFTKRLAEMHRIAYAKAKAEGKCPRCGRILSNNTHTVYCTRCLKKQTNRYKLKDYYSRAERPNYGRCYTCGKFELYSEKLCKDCWEKQIKRLKKINENPTPAMLEARKNWHCTNRLFFQSKKSKTNK